MNSVEIAAIYYPSWHSEPRRDQATRPGFTEWDLIQQGRPRFPGHYQPIVPTDGHYDECDPQVMRRTCDMAAGAGFDAFLWDWYWYEDADFLNRPLDETFMGLENPGLKFALMWANHDWWHVFPADVGKTLEVDWTGRVTRPQFEQMIEVVVNRYMTSEHYWLVEGRPWFTIFRIDELIAGLGGVEQTKSAIEHFRTRVREVTGRDLHFDVNGAEYVRDYPPTFLQDLGADSVSNYGWGESWIPAPKVPTVDYLDYKAGGIRWSQGLRESQVLEVCPSVAVGWDSSVRVNQEQEIQVSSWPFLPVVTGNTPERVGDAVLEAMRLAGKNEQFKIVTVNAWNEWTEGSYLEPSTHYGDQTLCRVTEAIQAYRQEEAASN